MKAGDTALVVSYDGRRKPAVPVDGRLNYWQLVGEFGEVVRFNSCNEPYCGAKPGTDVLVRFRPELLNGLDVIGDCLWLFPSDLKLVIPGDTAARVMARSLRKARENIPFDETLDEAAARGVPSAEFTVGMQYLKGEGRSRSLSKAKHWLGKAASHGCSKTAFDICCYDARFYLGLICVEGRGVTRDACTAVRYWRSAVAASPESQYALACCYRDGVGVEANRRRAYHWFNEAARFGYHYSIYGCAHALRYGRGTRKNLATAFEVLESIRDSNVPLVQYARGYSLASGEGTSADLGAARKCFRKAARKGDVDAMFNLAVCYQLAIGGRRDLKRAGQWYRAASRAGDREALQALRQLGKRLRGTSCAPPELRSDEHREAPWPSLDQLLERLSLA